jgi:hypothetical protein
VEVNIQVVGVSKKEKSLKKADQIQPGLTKSEETNQGTKT